MIGKVTRGSQVTRVIYYVYGRGTRNEHRDPHVVAGFRHPKALEPQLRANGQRDFRHLIDVLSSPMQTLRLTPLADPVWQCSMRAAPSDRRLSDEEWADIAEEVMHQTGFAPRGDDQACRWIAVRHADDHIHIIAALARDDGRTPRVWRDHLQVRDACRIVEERYGLVRTAPADRTAAPRPTRAENEQARRKGWSEQPRTKLRREVTAAAAAAGSEAEFFALLDGAGLLVHKRFSSQHPGEVTGYAVAVPGHTNAAGKPVRYSGAKLAGDLTLPKLRRRWSAQPDGWAGLGGRHGGRSSASSRTVGRTRARPSGVRLTFAERSAVYKEAARAVSTTTQQMRWTNDRHVRADLAAATSDMLHVAAKMTGNRHLEAAADSFGRAGREPYMRQPAPTYAGFALRHAARVLAVSCIHRGERRDRSMELTVELLRLIANLAALAEAVADCPRQAAQPTPGRCCPRGSWPSAPHRHGPTGRVRARADDPPIRRAAQPCPPRHGRLPFADSHPRAQAKPNERTQAGARAAAAQRPQTMTTLPAESEADSEPNRDC